MLNFILAFMFPFGQVGPIFPGPGGVNAGTTPVSYTFISSSHAGPSGSDPQTTGAVTADATGVLVAYCPGASSSGATWSVTSSPSNTWVPLAGIWNTGTAGGLQGRMFYALSPTAGSTTASCSLAGGPFGGEMAFLLSYSRTGGGAAAFDVSAVGSTSTVVSSVTTATFTTTASGLVVVCGGNLDVVTGGIGAIGSHAGTLRTPSGAGYSLFCGDTSFTAAQSSITATINYSGSFSPLVASVGAFK